VPKEPPTLPPREETITAGDLLKELRAALDSYVPGYPDNQRVWFDQMPNEAASFLNFYFNSVLGGRYHAYVNRIGYGNKKWDVTVENSAAGRNEPLVVLEYRNSDSNDEPSKIRIAGKYSKVKILAPPNNKLNGRQFVEEYVVKPLEAASIIF